MIYGYARVSTDGQSVEAQVAALTAAGAAKVFREVASGAKTDRAQLRRLPDTLAPGDVLTVTRVDRLARSTRDLLNTLAAITGKGAGFRSLGDTWADTTTAHGRLMLTARAPAKGASARRRAALSWAASRSSPTISRGRRSSGATREMKHLQRLVEAITSAGGQSRDSTRHDTETYS